MNQSTAIHIKLFLEKSSVNIAAFSAFSDYLAKLMPLQEKSTDTHHQTHTNNC